MINALMDFDASSLLYIQENLRFDLLNPIMVFITKLGDDGIIWILLGLVLLVPAKTRRGGFDVLVCLLLAFLVNDFILKDLFARIRPYEVINGLTILVPPETSFSFPSGHTNASFAAAMAMTLAFGKKGAWSFVLAALIAVSRCYVGVHYPTDIVGGIIVGTLLAWLAFYLSRKFIKADFIRKPKPE